MYGYGLLENIFSHMDHLQKMKAKKDAGVTSVNGYEGIERLNIPYKYDSIGVGGRYFSCRLDDTVTLYNTEGKFLFECTDYTYCKEGMFLVGNRYDNEAKKEFGYALYNEEKRLTDPMFSRYGMSDAFNSFGFKIAGIFESFRKTVVINKSGKIILEMDNFDSPYLYGVVCLDGKNYINLLTGETICEKGYRGSLDTDEFKFVQVESNCVYQINKNTGEYIIYGVPKPKEEPKAPIPIVKKVIEPQPKKQGRNELCNCGSGKKFKNCCI